MGDWGWGTGLAGWGTGCLVHIAGFRSWAMVAEKGAGKGHQCLEAKLPTRCQDAPPPLLCPCCFPPTQKMPTPPAKETS